MNESVRRQLERTVERFQEVSALLAETGLTTQKLRDVGRIAAVINAAAQVIAATQAPMSEAIAA